MLIYMVILMTNTQSLIRLQTWFSPAFPTGAFSYSHGLEQAITNKLVYDKESLAEWLTTLLKHGAGWNEAVLLSESWRLTKVQEGLVEISELAEAMSISKERHLETMAQGSAFLKAASAWGKLPDLPKKCALPVSVGSIAASYEVELIDALVAYLHAYVSNQIQAALRLMKLGQQAGVELLSKFEKSIIEVAEAASQTTLNDLGSIAFMADICAIQHEQLQSRIFRS